MTDRYTAILEDALSRLEAGDEDTREKLYGQARLSLLTQFEGDPELSLEDRAAELGRFEAAVRQIEARYICAPEPDPAVPPDTASETEPAAQSPAMAGERVAPELTAYPPPADFSPDADERLDADTHALRPRRRFPWLRLFLLIVIAALGAWAVRPLLAEYGGLARYAALGLHGLAVALTGAIVFIGSWRMLAAALAAPLMLAAILAGVERSRAGELILAIIFSPLTEQRAMAIDWQKDILQRVGLQEVGPQTARPQTAEAEPPGAAQPAGNAGDGPPAQAAGDVPPPQAPAGQPATETSTMTALTSPDALLGDWQVECDNGPGHRFTLAPPDAPSASDKRAVPHGRLTGRAFAGTSKVAFKSPLAENEIAREIAMPTHAWPGKEWVFSSETLLLQADYEEAETEERPGFVGYFICPVKAGDITVETTGADTGLSIRTECSWNVPKPADLDPFFTGTVSAQCLFVRP